MPFYKRQSVSANSDKSGDTALTQARSCAIAFILVLYVIYLSMSLGKSTKNEVRASASN